MNDIKNLSFYNYDFIENKVNLMEEIIGNNDYLIEIECDHIHLLFPLDNIKTIISGIDVQKSQINETTAIYQGREVVVYSLSMLLEKNSTAYEKYAFVVENEDIEAIVYVDEVKGIHPLKSKPYPFPNCLKQLGVDYIINCYMLEEGYLAFEIDFIKLLTRFYKKNIRRK